MLNDRPLFESAPEGAGGNLFLSAFLQFGFNLG